jgi:hypothetical protein
MTFGTKKRWPFKRGSIDGILYDITRKWAPFNTGECMGIIK